MLKHCCTILSLLFCLAATAQVPGKFVPQPKVKSTNNFTLTGIAEGIILNILVKKITSQKATIATASNKAEYDTTVLLQKINNKFNDPFYTPFAADLVVNTLAVQTINNQHSLTWQTNDEFNVGGYMVEKSIDGKRFTAIGSVEGTNTFAPKMYLFIDKNNDTLKYYYRLRVIGFDTKVQYTAAVKANASSGTSAIDVDNNATTHKLYFTTPLPIKKIEIVNTDGKVVINKKKIDILKPIDTNKLETGTYSIRTYTDNGVVSQLFFKIDN